MDEDEVISMLRSRGVQVPDKRLPRVQLASLLRALQQSIQDAAEEAGAQTEAEPRKRSSSRKRNAIKTGKDKTAESDAKIETRPRRKSAAADLRKPAEEEEEQVEDEPEKKRRRSSSKPVPRRRSSIRPAKRAAEAEEEVQEEPKAEEPLKRRRSSVTTRAKKRAAEQSAEEIEEVQEDEKKKKKEQVDETEEVARPAKRGRRSSVAKPKKQTNAEERSDDAMLVDEPRREQPEVPRLSVSPARSSPKGSARKSASQQPSAAAAAAAEPVPAPAAQGSFLQRFNFDFLKRMFHRSDNVPVSVPAPAEPAVAKKPRKSGLRRRSVAEPPHEEVVAPAPAAADNDEEEVVVEEAPVEKKKGIVVTPKLEKVVMSIGIALLLLFISLTIVLYNRGSDHGCGANMVWNGHKCDFSRQYRCKLQKLNSLLERFLANANDENRKIGSVDDRKEKLVAVLSIPLDDNGIDVSEERVAISLENAAKVVKQLSGEHESLDEMVESALGKEFRSPNLIRENDMIYCTNAPLNSFTLDCFEFMLKPMWKPICIVLAAVLVLAGFCFALIYFKRRYLDRLPSTNKLKELLCDTLKEQAAAAAAQAAASARSRSPRRVTVMPSTLLMSDLKTQVMNQLPLEERTNLVVRLRMNCAIRSLRSNNSIRITTTDVDGKPAESLKWVGKIDA